MKLSFSQQSILCICFLAFFASLSTLAATPDPDTLELEVEARELAFAQSMAERDIEAFQQFIAQEAIFFNGNEPIRGREAILTAWSVFFTEDDAPFSWQPDVVTVLDSGNLALSSGPVFNPAGDNIGRFNSVWRKEADGQWRVIFDKGS